MNTDIFDFKRFGKYLLADFKSCISKYGTNMIILSFCCIAVWLVTKLFILLTTKSWNGGETLLPALRSLLWFTVLFVTMLTVPSKCYGHLTDRSAGSKFLLLPASALEKTASMIINCIVIFAVVLLLFCCTDAIICFIDPNCGTNLFQRHGLVNLFTAAMKELEFDGFPTDGLYFTFFSGYLEDLLIFLLGALIFKKNKVAKTLGVILLISTAFSMIMTPLSISLVENVNMNDTEMLAMLKDKLGWLFNNMIPISNVLNSIVNVGLMVAIYFRVKTIKH